MWSHQKPTPGVQQPTIGRDLTSLKLLLHQAVQPLGPTLERQTPQMTALVKLKRFMSKDPKGCRELRVSS